MMSFFRHANEGDPMVQAILSYNAGKRGALAYEFKEEVSPYYSLMMAAKQTYNIMKSGYYLEYTRGNGMKAVFMLMPYNNWFENNLDMFDTLFKPLNDKYVMLCICEGNYSIMDSNDARFSSPAFREIAYKPIYCMLNEIALVINRMHATADPVINAIDFRTFGKRGYVLDANGGYSRIDDKYEFVDYNRKLHIVYSYSNNNNTVVYKNVTDLINNEVDFRNVIDGVKFEEL